MSLTSHGCVFPLSPENRAVEHGIRERDWVAIQAMTGILASNKLPADPKDVAKLAYAVADAMIVESDKNLSARPAAQVKVSMPRGN